LPYPLKQPKFDLFYLWERLQSRPGFQKGKNLPSAIHARCGAFFIA
jgi:hypothetical protein